MDLHKEWRNMSQLLVNDTTNKFNQNLSLPKLTNNALEEIREKLKWKLTWIRVINVPILCVVFFLHGDLQILLFIIFVFYEIFRTLAFLEYRKINKAVDYNTSTRQVLQHHYNAINKFLLVERVWSYVILPLSAPAGFLLYKLTINNNIEQIADDQFFIYQLLVISLIGLPLIYFSKISNQKLFSKHLKSLKIKIDEIGGSD